MFRRWILKQSIRRHGILAPVLVNKRGIVLDGRTRVSIAKELGLQVPVIRVDSEIEIEEANNLITF